MARPREGSGIKRTIVKKGGKMYAYEYTSRMVDGKKVNESKYLGRVDPITLELLPKIPEKSKENRKKIAKDREIAILKGVDSGDYGAVYLMHVLQLRMDLGLDLMRSFGHMGKTILAAAMALAMGRGRFDEVASTFKRTWLRRFFDLAGSVDSGTLSRLTEYVGEAKMNIERFFELRVGGSEGLVAWDTTTNGCYSDMDGMAEWVVNNKDNEYIKQIKTGFATDMRGIPLMYRHYPGTMSDIAVVDRMADDVERFGRKDVLFVFDRGSVSGANAKCLIDRNRKFVMPANRSSKAVKTLLTEFGRTKEKKDMVFRGHAYKVWETEIGIVKDVQRTSADGNEAFSFTIPEWDRHGSCGRMNAFVCFDSEKYSNEVQSHFLMMDSLKEKASKIDSKDPVTEFKRIAGMAVKHFTIEQNGRKVIVTEKKNSLSFEENRAGMFVMLASQGISWDVMMNAYDARRLTEQAFDFEKSEDRRFRTSDKVRMEGRGFIRFVELMMICEMSAEIRESGRTDMSVAGTIASLNTIEARSYGSTTVLTEVTKKCREIFKAFGMAVPTAVIEGTEVCDLMRL
jgi:hypothetical protein